MHRHPEYQYLEILRRTLEHGERKIDRTGVGTLSTFGTSVRFSLENNQMPILTTKRIYWKTAAKELLWFLSGETNIQPLVKANCTIWTDWPLERYRAATQDNISQAAFEERITNDDAFAAQWGELGPVYGKQWRRWMDADGKEHDQIGTLIETLKTNPDSRRLLFHGWNVGELDKMALPPCHLLYQFYVSGAGERGHGGLTYDQLVEDTKQSKSGGARKLNCILYQRSCDLGLGVGWNFFNAALLTRMIAQQVGMEPGELIWFGGDAHLYFNHIPMAMEMLAREPTPWPTLEFARKPASIDEYRIEDLVVSNYVPNPPISAPVAV